MERDLFNVKINIIPTLEEISKNQTSTATLWHRKLALKRKARELSVCTLNSLKNIKFRKILSLSMAALMINITIISEDEVTKNGATGVIPENLLEETDEAQESNYYVCGDTVFVRRGPSKTDYPKPITSLNTGDQVRVIDTFNNWAKINMNGQSLFISKTYLRKVGDVDCPKLRKR